MMLKTKFTPRIFQSSLAIAIAVAMAPLSMSLADNNPWQGSATGYTAPDPDNPGQDCDVFLGWGGGQVGNFTADGCHTLDPVTGEFFGFATWMTISGNTLNINYTGQVFPTDDPDFPFGFVGTLNANGGTGDLVDAVGTADWSGGFSGVPGVFFFNFDGTLETSGNYRSVGLVRFTNIQGSLGNSEPASYFAPGVSPQIGFFIATGSILPTSQPEVDPLQSTEDTTVLRFTGQQGPNPFFFGLQMNVQMTRHGLIFSQWDGLFTIEVDNATGNSVFKGDGHFIVLGGTGLYSNTTGSFQTLFATGNVPAGADNAIGVYGQDGTLD